MRSRAEPRLDPDTLARLEARARVLKAMAHPTRLFILFALERGERCVCELKDMIGADVSTVSRHLSLLRDAGIVRDEKRGAQVFYSLVTPCVLSYFSCIERVLETTAEQKMLLVRRPAREASPPREEPR